MKKVTVISSVILAVAQKEDLCRKAAVSAMNEYRFIAG